MKQPVTIYVCNVMGELLYTLEDIDKSSVSLHELLNGQAELSFTYKKSKDIPSPAYDALEEGMYIFVETVGHFKMRQPSIRVDAATESKSVTAYSCDVEFEDKVLSFDVNMGQETSSEYLVEYEDGETEVLVNPYTGIPYDWIVLYNTYPEQLTALASWYAEQEQVEHEVTVRADESEDDFNYLDAIITQIPRLCHKAVDADHYVQYVTKITDASDAVIGYILGDGFGTRISDLITYYTKYRSQLSLLDIVCDHMGGTWVPGDIYGVADGDYSLANKRYQFEINEGAYSFLASTLAQKSKCVVSFDKLERKINVTPVEYIGEDTGIELSYSQLLNTLSISTNEDTLATRITVHGAEGLTGDPLSIEQVNFGENYVIDIDYKLNARNTNGKRIYVSDELAEKYARYKTYRNDVLRPAYVDKSREINALQAEIYELKYRLPADSLKTDWDAMTDEELEGSLTKFSNMLHALYELYSEDYGREWLPQSGELPPWVNLESDRYYPVPEWIYRGEDETMIPRTEFIQNTPYWYDYVAYCETITQIYIAMQARYSSDVSFKYANIADGSGNDTVQDMYDKISAWETEWSLYGTQELQHKIGAYDTQMQAMIDADIVQVKHLAWGDLATMPFEAVSDTTGANPHTNGWLELIDNAYVVTEDTSPQTGKTYYTSLQTCFADQTGTSFDNACEILEKKKAWGYLESAEKAFFSNNEPAYMALLDAKITLKIPIAYDDLTVAQKQLYGNMTENYPYDDYKKIYDLRQEAQDACDEMQAVVDAKTVEMETAQTARQDIMIDSKIETYENDGESFTPYECKVLTLLYRDAEYSNDNILTTSLDTTVSAIDKMLELYEDAVEQAIIFSRPQLTFTVEADNIMALPQFAAWESQFKLGNYIYIEYSDGMAIQVRMVGYTYNPVLNTGGFSMEFSDMVYSKLKVSDVESVLGMASGSASSSWGSSGGGGGVSGEFSDLSDTMLQKLLTPESFVKEVSDVVANKIVKKSLTTKEQIYNSLVSGDADINGSCITIGDIRSEAVNSLGLPISVLHLNDGTFSFGDGSLMFYYDGEINGQPVPHLRIEGEVNATVGLIGGVKLGWIDVDNYDADLINRLCFDSNGMSYLEPYYIQVASPSGYNPYNEKWVVRHGDVYEYATETTPEAGETYYRVYWKTFFGIQEFSNGWQFELSKLYLPGDVGYNGIYPVYSDHINIGTSLFTGGRYASNSIEEHRDGNHTVVGQIDLDFVDGSVTATGEIEGSSLKSNGAISATGTITASGQITGGSFGPVSSSGAVSGTSLSARNGGMITGGQMSITKATTDHSYGVVVSGKYNPVTSTYNNIRAQDIDTPSNFAELQCGGNIYCTGTVSGASGVLNNADYAEYFEWEDGNLNYEDRRGRFVTLDGDKIRLATQSDAWVYGIVSSTPSVVGDAANTCWCNKYLRDEFGAILTEPVEHPAELDDDGNAVVEAYVTYVPIINPEYDETREYIPRSQRAEWAPVGMVGKLIMLDDGTCEVNGFATSADEGIATKTDGVTNYRVIKRIDSNHILVAAK